MSDDPVDKCQVCGAPVERVFHPVAVHFKGSGFYTTDYGRGNRSGASSDSGSKDESKSKTEAAGSKSESSDSGSGSTSGSGSGSESGASSGDS